MRQRILAVTHLGKCMSSQRLLGFCLLVMLSPLAVASVGTSNCDKDRDTHAFEKAGPFSILLGTPREKREELMAQIRSFLWNHWTEKSRAELVMVTESVEGDRTTSFIHVEPDDTDDWHVCVKMQRTLVSRTEPGKKIKEQHSFQAVSVERVEIRKDGISPYTVIPHSVMRSSDAYRLVLRDATGKALTEL